MMHAVASDCRFRLWFLTHLVSLCSTIFHLRKNNIIILVASIDEAISGEEGSYGNICRGLK